MFNRMTDTLMTEKSEKVCTGMVGLLRGISLVTNNIIFPRKLLPYGHTYGFLSVHS